MTKPAKSFPDKISQIISDPSRLAAFDERDWDLLVRQARAASMMGRMSALLESAPYNQYPQQAQALRQFSSSLVIAEKQRKMVEYEIECINNAFEKRLPVVVLKGAAYVLAGLPAAEGRVFSDIDILVPKAKLAQAESALMSKGWRTTKLDAYDQRYYRKWMHELPPLTHFKRATTIDVHHNILPDTARLHPRPDLLLMGLRAIPDCENVYVFSPVDMVLHSATHLFHEGELDKGLRDLTDLDTLIRYFSIEEPDFWFDLVPRAKDLDLMPPLYYAIRFCRRVLNTPVPQEISDETEAGKPRFPRIMDFLYDRALMPDHYSCDDRFTGFARWLLYIRSHYLRMPLYLLLPHLLRKAWIGLFEKDSEKE